MSLFIVEVGCQPIQRAQQRHRLVRNENLDLGARGVLPQLLDRWQGEQQPVSAELDEPDEGVAWDGLESRVVVVERGNFAIHRVFFQGVELKHSPDDISRRGRRPFVLKPKVVWRQGPELLEDPNAEEGDDVVGQVLPNSKAAVYFAILL